MTTKKNELGFLEPVTICGPDRHKKVMARIDTGAARNSIDKNLAKKLGIQKVIHHKIVKSAHGVKKRPIVKAKLKIADKEFENMTFTLADRTHMKYDVLIGRNTIKKGFLINPDK
ncbi:RimK/LysX family protein [Candidatus Woesearchaeota archaeon]|nr:RimK/LysX family protein [Candidatus Woesearchaeota archaeon]